MEAKVLFEVDQAANKGRGDEDIFIELKRELPTADRSTARRIGGLCNAANGHEVIWIVGIDGKTGEVQQLDSIDLQAWWPSVAKWFDEFPPEMRDIVVPTGDGKAVLGMFFSTDRAPYVVKLEGDARFETEIPWREATRTRSAKRSEIIRILEPAVSLPGIELVAFTLDVQKAQRALSHDGKTDMSAAVLDVDMTLFVEAREPVSFPMHRQALTLRVGGQEFEPAFPVSSFGFVSTETVIRADGAVTVLYPSHVRFRAGLTLYEDVDEIIALLWGSQQVDYNAKIAIIGTDRQVALAGKLEADISERIGPNELASATGMLRIGRWELEN